MPRIIEFDLSQKEISLIVGPRQAGKTTLMLLLQDELRKLGQKTLFLNLDIDRDKEFLLSQEKLINRIKLEFGKETGFVFIDEIQRKENAGVFLKGIYDMKLPYKLIVSGSGSLELKEKIHESLVGRKRIFELGTVSFDEFVNFKTEYKYEDRLKEFFKADPSKARAFLEEHLNFGGYPRVILSDSLTDKTRVISEIYQSYLEKDVSYLLGLPKTEGFTSLVKILASQIGGLVNVAEMSSTLSLSSPTVKKYLWYLEKTFVAARVSPYFRNLRKEITKSPIYYFFDLGLRNYALGSFGSLNFPGDKWLVFENFVFNILREKIGKGIFSINFWRTKDGAEVDFVLDLGREILPIEVKYKELSRIEISRSLRSFIARYKPKRAWVVNLNFKSIASVDGTQVQFLPYYELLFNFSF